MTVRILLLVAAVVAVSACGQSTSVTGPSASQIQSAVSAPSGPASVTVSIVGGNQATPTTDTGAATSESFTPDSVTISPGMQVNFYNDDGLAHSLVSDDGSWSSGNMDSEATFTVTFANAGTFRYHDAAHPEIGGTVIVK
jgi:plastocyanin